MQCHDSHINTHSSKICTFLHECLHAMPMFRVLTDSLTHAFAMYEKPFSKQKIFVFEHSLDNLRQPSDVKIHWTTLRYHNLLDNPSISNSFIGQLSDIKFIYLDNLPISNSFIWTTLQYYPFKNPCHALTPVSRDVPVHKCNANASLPIFHATYTMSAICEFLFTQIHHASFGQSYQSTYHFQIKLHNSSQYS